MNRPTNNPEVPGIVERLKGGAGNGLVTVSQEFRAKRGGDWNLGRLLLVLQHAGDSKETRAARVSTLKAEAYNLTLQLGAPDVELAGRSIARALDMRNRFAVVIHAALVTLVQPTVGSPIRATWTAFGYGRITAHGPAVSMPEEYGHQTKVTFANDTPYGPSGACAIAAEMPPGSNRLDIFMPGAGPEEPAIRVAI